MMGSWKSTIGKELAEKLKLQFIDIDDAIEDVTSMKISDIFNEFGQKKFREMEGAFFTEITKQNGYVFSTGGGIILESENRNILLNNGISILLNASTEILARRISNTTKRPLIKNSISIKPQLDKIWSERKTFYYNSAHITIETDLLKPNQVLEKILILLEEKYAKN